ncbi:MAG: hypothetical protein JW902_16155 [Syntrophaceae bacterium]|nr:hypothetical protein [Syntrophaceae bacterium]
MAANILATGLEQRLLNQYVGEGLKNCAAQAKQNNGCCGCCVIRLYLITGKYDSWRDLVFGSSLFFSKPCFMVQADMVAYTGPTIEPYFGRYDYRNFLERLRPNGEKERLDNQTPMPQFEDFCP